MRSIYSGREEEWLDDWLAASLYESKADEHNVLFQASRLRAFSGKFETFCPQCGKDSIFTVAGDRNAEIRLAEESIETGASGQSAGIAPAGYWWLGSFSISLTCSRHEFHFIRLYFELEYDHTNRAYRLTKVGQWPSLVDFRVHDVGNLESAFSKPVAREWRRSLITAAHGFNVAACVHLRRAVEGILREARDRVDGGSHKGQAWAEFDAGRMADRIRLVAGELPSLLVEHPRIYSILSKGVHELSEEECAGELPILQRALRVMALQILEARSKAKEAAEVASLLRDAQARHSQRIGPGAPDGTSS